MYFNEEDFKSEDNNSVFSGTKLGESSELEKSLGIQAESDTDQFSPLVKEYMEQDEAKTEKATKLEGLALETSNEELELQTEKEVEAMPVVEDTKEEMQEEPSQKKEETTIEKQTKEYENTLKNYKVGDIVTGKIVNTGRNVLVDIDYKSEGIIEAQEILPNDKLQIGDIVSVYIVKLENKDGHPVLSKRIADIENAWKFMYDVYKNKKDIEVDVISAVKGGLVAEYQSIRGFIPGSQALLDPEQKQEDLVGKKLLTRIIEIDRKRKKIVFSNKLAMQSSLAENKEKLWQDLQAGQVKTGVITSIKPFGIFVDIGGSEGLVHISEMAWHRVTKPSALVKVGDKIDVFVLGVDVENKKISLGMKQLQPDPWVGVEAKYKRGQILDGKVSRIVSFGAFVDIGDGIEGLVHISELANNHVEKAGDAVRVGEPVKVKILRIDADNQKIGLSIKATLNDQGSSSKKEKEDDFAIYQKEQIKNRKEVTIGDIMINGEN